MGVTQEEERIGPKKIGPNLCTTDLRRDLNIYWLKLEIITTVNGTIDQSL